MKKLLLTFTTLVMLSAFSRAANANPGSDRAGICEFYTGDSLQLRQRCAIRQGGGTGSLFAILNWEDGVKTQVDQKWVVKDNGYVTTVDGESAIKEPKKKNSNCYRITKNDRQVCFQADTKEPIRIIHGCGTGCAVNSIMITNVRRNSHKLNGKKINTSTFFGHVTGGRGSSGEQGRMRYSYAACSSKEIGFSSEYNKAPEKLLKLFGNSDDYITAFGAMGYYFDALCS